MGPSPTKPKAATQLVHIGKGEKLILAVRPAYSAVGVPDESKMTPKPQSLDF